MYGKIMENPAILPESIEIMPIFLQGWGFRSCIHMILFSKISHTAGSMCGGRRRPLWRYAAFEEE